MRKLAAGARWRTQRKRCARRFTPLAGEVLEPRCCPAAIVMSDYEQFLIEMINDARADPVGLASRGGIDLNQGLAPGTISANPKQPLAPHQALVNAAGAHTEDMLKRGFFAHVNPDGKSPSDRAQEAGYPSGAGENISKGAMNGGFNQTFAVIERHLRLFLSPGHRANMLTDSYREIGNGVRFGQFISIVTENFGARFGDPFVTGVVFADTVTADNFYTPGEGIGNVTITATNSQGTPFSTQSGPSGGYSIQAPAGVYTVRAEGTALGSPMIVSNVVVGEENRKVDFVSANKPEIAVELNGSNLSDGLLTPIDFGSVQVGHTGSARTFTVRNVGNASLILDAVDLPVGFTLVEGLASSLPRGGSDTFTIRLESSAVGAKAGELNFDTNDADENPFDFPIVGTVTAPPTPPTISDIANRETKEDTSTGPIAFTIGDAEFAATQLTVSASSSNAALIPAGNVSFGGSGASRTIAVTPAANQSGSATITVTVTDPSGLSASDSFLLTVTPVNDAPTIAPIGDQFIVKDGSRTVSFVIQEVETPVGQLAVLAEASNELVVPPGGLNVSGTGATRTVALQAAAGQEGTTTVTVRVNDGALEASRSFTVWVLENPYPWHNAAKPMDVNNSNTVEPLDALLVINYLNAGFSASILPTAVIGGLAGFGWIDTNASNEVAPLDALLVINALNAGVSGEGEAEESGDRRQGTGVVGQMTEVMDEAELMALLAFDAAEEISRRRRGR